MTRADSSADSGTDDAALDARLTQSPPELAHYIADMTSSLSRLAREAGLDLLAHLLDVARIEALQQSSTRIRPPRS